MSAVVVPIVPAIELKRVLFTTDFTDASQRALPILAAIARRYGSKVYAAHVWTPGPYSMMPPGVIAVLDQQSEWAAKGGLERLSQSHVLDGIEVEPLVRCGRPAEEISRLAGRHNISLAVMTTHGRTGFKHRMLGSVAEEVIRTLRCPVLTVGPGLAERFANLDSIKNILFPTDFSVESRAVFPYLASLAHEYESRLTILHVLSPETASARDKEGVADRLRRKMKKILEGEISPRCCTDYVIECGEPAETILTQARHVQADVIGLGVRGWTGIAKHFRETVTYRILAQAECPVLTHHGAY